MVILFQHSEIFSWKEVVLRLNIHATQSELTDAYLQAALFILFQWGNSDLYEVNRIATFYGQPGEQSPAETEVILRWGLKQALYLIKTHEEAPIQLATAMQRNASVEECGKIIHKNFGCWDWARISFSKYLPLETPESYARADNIRRFWSGWTISVVIHCILQPHSRPFCTNTGHVLLLWILLCTCASIRTRIINIITSNRVISRTSIDNRLCTYECR